MEKKHIILLLEKEARLSNRSSVRRKARAKAKIEKRQLAMSFAYAWELQEAAHEERLRILEEDESNRLNEEIQQQNEEIAWINQGEFQDQNIIQVFEIPR
jgi:transcription termination factor NusB